VLAQAYYTSCEVGLSDFAGFQFNAATPGLTPQVLSEVEALTSYEPPRSLGYRADPAEIAACPVNLVYHCEPTTVLANVVYVGLDSSRRLGNYFAHALISDSGPAGFAGTLPIELWGSPVWTSDPIQDGELPVIPGPAAASGVTRARVEAFLADRRRSDQLAVLVTAAEEAVLHQGRPIVVVEADTDQTAHWIAAVSYLLPAPVARRMGFATYRHRPEYSDAHIIGTLPDSDFDLGDGPGGYVVFDPASGRISDLDPDPAAALLVRAGVGVADRLWATAGSLVPQGARTSLAAAYPALVAAALLSGTPVTEADLNALAGWALARRSEVAVDRRGDLVAVWLEHPARGPQHLAALAGLVDDHDLRVRIEQAAVSAELDLGTSTGVPLTTAEGRASGADRCARSAITATPETAVALLAWSGERGLVLAGDVQQRLTALAALVPVEPAVTEEPRTSWWRRCLR
jgi:hypothetical protein